MSLGKLTIDMNAIRSNYRILKSKVSGSCRVAAVVKANAYSLGATPVSKALIQEGCNDFFVASIKEALELRPHVGNAEIYVLNGFYSSYADAYYQHNLTPVIGSFMEIEGYKALGKKHGKALPAFLHFNTRMNRLGLGSVETRELLGNLSMLDGIEVTGVMSHFACADEKDHPLTKTQHDVFKDIAMHFPHAQKSLCNSSGIFRSDTYHYDLVRPGMALYGLNPTPEQENPMTPVLTLETPVIRLRLVYKDAYIGYGATHQFNEDTPLATVASGYADGIFWGLSNKGCFYWKGYACPIRGRVSMDLTTVDLSAVPEKERPRPGDYLEIIGPHQREADLAKQAGSFDYEVLTSLGQRYERSYIGTLPD